MPERRGYSEKPRKETEEPPYHQEVRFPGQGGEHLSDQVYAQAQEIVYQDDAAQLSAYRLMLNAIYHVAVLGEQPSSETGQKIQVALSRGEPTTLPSDVLKALNQRRLQMKQHGEWVEGHYRPGKPLDE